MEDFDTAIINFYMSLTFGKIESLFHKRLQDRYWVIYYPFSCEFNKQFYRHAISNLMFPYLGNFDDSDDKRYVRSFYSRYLHLTDIGEESLASDLLNTIALIKKLTIEEGYDLFIYLSKVQAVKINQRIKNESNI